MHYRTPDSHLPEIPLIDCDEGGAGRLFDLSAIGARRLAAILEALADRSALKSAS
jgi:hypothetical protein